MTRGQRALLSAARGGMEIAWRQAWASSAECDKPSYLAMEA